MKLPVKPGNDRDIIDADGCWVSFTNTTATRDLIVQAINSHKKLKEALEETGRDFYHIHRYSEDAHNDSYEFANKIEQVLKELEKL